MLEWQTDENVKLSQVSPRAFTCKSGSEGRTLTIGLGLDMSFSCSFTHSHKSLGTRTRIISTIFHLQTLLRLSRNRLSIDQQTTPLPLTRQNSSTLQHGHSGCSSSTLPGLNQDLFGSCQRCSYDRNLHIFLRQDSSHGLASWQTRSLGPCPARHHLDRSHEPGHVPQPRHTQ
jgi:hypothetical protein